MVGVVSAIGVVTVAGTVFVAGVVVVAVGVLVIPMGHHLWSPFLVSAHHKPSSSMEGQATVS
jgi:hypothetical protein